MVLFWLGVRVGNLLPESRNKLSMVAKRAGIKAVLTAGQCSEAVLTLPYTKTQNEELERVVPSAGASVAAHMCPLRCLQLAVQDAPHLPAQSTVIFLHPETQTPLTRPVFMREVHSWMLQVPGLDVQRFSGVSFRKGCLQELHRAGQSRIQVATQAAHRSIQSQRWYISMDSRVQQQNAHVLAAALA